MLRSRASRASQSSPRGWSRRVLFIACPILLVIGSALLTASYASRGQLAENPIEPVAIAVPPRPSPTWGPMPTRAVTPEPLETPDLTALHRALLRRDLVSAERAWTDALVLVSTLPEGAYPDKSELFRAGARLALMQNNLTDAEERIRRVIRVAPTDARAWSLLGVVLDRAGDTGGAKQALDTALALDLTLAPELFSEQWAIARALQDSDALVALADLYSLHNPDTQLEPYYRGEALLAIGDHRGAIEVLVGALTEEPTAPALLWYTLGNAYLAGDAYREAAMVLEVAAVEVAGGDTSLTLVTDDAIIDLNVRLARAYLATQRCAEAEDIFRRLSSQDPDLQQWLDEAITCQTPTPTLTPWIPRQVTATPRW